MKEDTQGNPEAVENGVFGSESDDFFTALDQDVNGLVQDEEVTPQAQAQETPQVDPRQEANVTNGAQPSELDNLKKRYSDSSREAQNLKAQLDELKPYVPVLNAMKKDNGLVSHVRDYFDNQTLEKFLMQWLIKVLTKKLIKKQVKYFMKKMLELNKRHIKTNYLSKLESLLKEMV